MRYLITSMPVLSHLLPLVPLAQQLVLDGHDVLVATSGAAADAARRAGLTTVDAGGSRDARAPYDRLLDIIESGNAGHGPVDEDSLALHGEYFGEVGLRMLDDLLEIGRAWGADAVVYPGIHSAALVAAHQLGAVGILHGYGSPLPTFEPALAHILASRPDLPDRVPEAGIEIDVLPPSLPNFAELPWTNGVPAHRLTMRYGSFNGAADVPRWLLGEREVPRIVLTCGSAEAQSRRGATYRQILEALDGTPCEAVILAGSAQLDLLPDPLPSWVRLEKWLPLKFTLDHSDTIVHHAGSGTVLTAFDSGLTQVGIPMPGTVSVGNARWLPASGAGTMLDLGALDTDELAKAVVTALTSPEQRAAALAVQREIHDMPSVREVATRVSAIVAEYSATKQAADGVEPVGGRR
ncbi:glycosyltransferase [Actinokineospora globicatena]|uniref:Glycosyl transferase n=1 Tax=Actinokineospora globicatena TaxID=103729 RepID=A0A9W6V720_9PSEU|nr:glycosyltransferase [Actinokineospora globicatena]GLW89539.1 glycosyl transferase [Actinokineospora globicatena]